ncbi:tRNA threonylcarbamoyladenosine dehydratase 2 [Golovinomyces cichoracearum]|uniref:tRNA threonylcarbamoyladenosine dehydratase 2 n=1 Tax=Golovinomyces cichoracearum TaxID=62708 RepID=A0A420JBP7_9PEZI|nr:tRNA threonylcarbamoyladenosine dehydratase 2 [Golovinomyces cichoracearum]
MSLWWSRTAPSTNIHIAATAVISGSLVAATILGYQTLMRQEKLERLKKDIPPWEENDEQFTKIIDVAPLSEQSMEDQRYAALAEKAHKGEYDDDLILEQLARNRVFLTDEGLKKLRSAFVVVVGCGGVGSHCASALVRSGVSNIRLIDFDQVTLSSLNRHAVATLADVGIPKVTCLEKRLHQIAPWVKFDLRNELYREEISSKLLEDWGDRRPDYIVDAIDNINSKVSLLKYCYDHQLPVISSMGAGAKSDPTRIFIGDISASTDDPLSRATRRRLRAYGVTTGIPVVYSTEKPSPGKAQLMPLPEEEFIKGSIGELGVLPDFRLRIMPVLGTMPAVFGYAAANHIILQITGYPSDYIPAKAREKMYEAIHAQIQGAEEKLARALLPDLDTHGLRLSISVADVGYVVEEVFKGRSVITGLTTRLTLVRWRKPLSANESNGKNIVDYSIPGQLSGTISLIDLVCMTKEEAAIHTRNILLGHCALEDFYDSSILAYVEGRIQEEIMYNKYR